MMDEFVSIGGDDDSTRPARIRAPYGVRVGGTYRLIQSESELVLVPATSSVSELASEIATMREEAGLEMDELLQSLREERERYFLERYGPHDDV